MKTWISVLLSLASVLAAGLTFAGGAWSHTVNHRYAGGTSIEITEPKGFAVEVTVGDEVKKDTIPAIINLPSQDAYVPVTVTSTDGASWAEKIEVRTKQQTTLVVSYSKPKAEPAQAPRRSYAGNVALLAGKSCGGKWRGRDVRFDFIDAESGKSAGEARFTKDDSRTFEITGGRYDVRLYMKYKGGYSYYDTKTIEVQKDGWIVGFGCQRGSSKPALLFK